MIADQIAGGDRFHLYGHARPEGQPAWRIACGGLEPFDCRCYRLAEVRLARNATRTDDPSALAYGNSGCWVRPAVSSRLRLRFIFRVAWPEAPFTPGDTISVDADQAVVRSAHIAAGYAWTPSATSANSEPFPGGGAGAAPMPSDGCRGGTDGEAECVRTGRCRREAYQTDSPAHIPPRTLGRIAGWRDCPPFPRPCRSRVLGRD